MYLSRVEIDMKNRRKIRDLNHLGAYHNWVEQSFPQEFEKEIRTRKLWRIDEVAGKTYLLVLSEKKPDIACMEKYGISGTGQTKSYNRLLDSIENGRRYHFRLTANPVYAKSSGNPNTRGRVVSHITIEQQMEFLKKKAIKNGFSLDGLEFFIVSRKYHILKKENCRDARISCVTYEGILTVTDKEEFQKALTHGIGKKKAYGCGLLTIIPEK